METVTRLQKQVRVDPALWHDAKVRAVMEEKGLSEWIEELIREALKKPRK